MVNFNEFNSLKVILDPKNEQNNTRQMEQKVKKVQTKFQSTKSSYESSILDLQISLEESFKKLPQEGWYVDEDIVEKALSLDYYTKKLETLKAVEAALFRDETSPAPEA